MFQKKSVKCNTEEYPRKNKNSNSSTQWKYFTVSFVSFCVIVNEKDIFSISSGIDNGSWFINIYSRMMKTKVYKNISRGVITYFFSDISTDWMGSWAVESHTPSHPILHFI